MSIARIAHRFATAILDSMPEGPDREVFLNDLADVRSSVLGSRELLLFFQSPVISEKLKMGTVDALFADRVQSPALAVIRFLVEKGREEYIMEIIDTVFTLHRDREGILSTSIHSAVDLGEDQRSALHDKLEQLSGKRIEVQYDVDAALLGGLIVRMDDMVYDGSVRHTLQRLRDHLVRGA
ncbi:MAG: ATP synthase F1 subunit delta [Bacteroidetes bacterium]|nr:ATP synthase F1 subunit delta [Bacteroidota bacterium]